MGAHSCVNCWKQINKLKLHEWMSYFNNETYSFPSQYLHDLIRNNGKAEYLNSVFVQLISFDALNVKQYRWQIKYSLAMTKKYY